MVDIHSHVLPGLDDGARTIEESLEKLRLAAASGTTDIVATPHANSEFAFDDERVRSIFREVSHLSEGFIRLYLGCDFHLSYDNLLQAIQNPGRFTINQGRYLMLELPDIVSSSTVRTALGQLLNARIVPIITHPERNESIQGNFSEMKAWREQGCFLQITGQSLLGRFGPAAQSAAQRLLSSGLADFVASDAHDCFDRSPELSSAYEIVRSRYGSRRAVEVFIENPTAIISDELIYPKKSMWKQRFGFGRFMK